MARPLYLLLVGRDDSALGVRLLSEVDDSRLDLAHGHDRVPHPLRPDPRVLDALRFRFGV